MSSRALRKLQQKTAAGGPTVEDVDGSDTGPGSDEEPSLPARKGPGNQFALLMQQDSELLPGGSADSESEEREAEEGTAAAKAASNRATPGAKKKCKKKLKSAAKGNSSSSKGGKPPAGTLEDDFDAVLRLPDSHQVENTCPTPAQSLAANVKPLLSVDLRLLDGGQELRRLFGQASGERLPAIRGQGPRRGLLVQPKPTWPPVVRLGLSMSADSSVFPTDAFPSGSCVYRFEHSREYQRTQAEFAEAVDSGDPERIADILRRQPYHIDSLLQLAEVFRIQEDAATAADLVERALYAMECAMSPGFSMANDRCRLSFARRENRGIFAALLRHALALAGKCCYRACLETCKLMLSLNPSTDPMGSLLLLDSACLMCGQEEFLLRLLQAWESSRHLSQLPNWAYSGALARFRLGRSDANAALDEALLLFPSVLPALLSRLGVEPGARVSSCRLFSPDNSSSSSPGLSQLCSLYVRRCGHCWKEAAAITFLVGGAARVAAIAEAATPPDPRVAAYAERRLRRYRRTPLNVLRHLVASDAANEALADLPGDVDPASALNAFDPLPPQDSVCDYDLSSLRTRLRGAAGGGGGATGADETGMLSAFLRSMLPDYDPNAPPQQQPWPAAEGGGRLAGLLDSVRQLLNGLGPPPPPEGEGGAGADGN